MTNDQFDVECSRRKLEATNLLRSAKINGDVKNRHKFCACLGISTAVYNSVMDPDAPQIIHTVEMASRIIRNWHKLAKLKRDKPVDAPDFEEMAKFSAQGAGRI
jgi:hypothetical protein